MADVVNTCSDSDDEPQLSEHTLLALQEFYAERMQLGANPSGFCEPEEDWQLSQFWYNEQTAVALANEVLRASHNRRIACISCPTLFAKLVEIAQSKQVDCDVYLLEFDRRFEVYGSSFVYYDYNSPLNLPQPLTAHSFGIVVADPPFLSEECLCKVAQTITFLAQDKVILCTGAVMEELALKLLNVRPCGFTPRHNRNLANEFLCYTNYECTIPTEEDHIS